MTTAREQYLLERCIRLEAKLLGIEVAPARIQSQPLLLERKKQQRVTPVQIAQMRELRARGASYTEIARRTKVSQSTARDYALDIQKGANP